ncbi:MAG: hypothetical protein MUE37_03300 [Bacteroidales bacterium]|nr:hypothetical protein [Bacteroidales bacterium]
MKAWIQILAVYFLLPLQVANGQALPPIRVFTPEDYGADNQNWQITQAEDRFIYVANNRGLLEFNGSEWNLYPSPNNTIIRCVKAIGNRIYSGSYMEFGYWLRNRYGKLEYTSLLPFMEENLKDDDQIWTIHEFNEWVVFQSSAKLYFFNPVTEKFRIVDPDKNIYRAFRTSDNIYFNVRSQGIYRLENGIPVLLIDDPEIKNKRVISIFDIGNELIILTIESGFYRLEGNRAVRLDIPANDLISDGSIFCGLQLSDGSFVIGTIPKGIIHINPEGYIDYRIDQTNGLSNNTVLSLFEDIDNNLWAGLDNGINCVNITSPVQVFHDFDGILGTVYTSEVFGGYLYLGTNQGLFCREEGKNVPFRFIENTSGQVWDLYNYKDKELLCGHHLGTYIIRGEKAILIDENPGTWAFKELPGRDDMLLKGNYNGLSVLEKASGTWRIRNTIDGFSSSARFFEVDARNQVWVSHEYKGVYRLRLNEALTKVLEVNMEPFPSDLKNSSLVVYNDNLLYAYEKGIFRYDDHGRSFVYDSLLSPLITSEEYVSGKLVADGKGRLWGFSNDNIYSASIDHLTSTPRIEAIPIPLKLRKVTQSFENITPVSDNIYLLGTANGYLTVDLSRINRDEVYRISLNSVTIEDLENNLTGLETGSAGVFRFNGGIITLRYSVPVYSKYLDVRFQYKLEGHTDRWSEWSHEPESSFENLGAGKYVFMARARIGNSYTENTISYSFRVNRPWYLSNEALAVYFLLLVLIGFTINMAYNRHYEKMLKREQLEKDKLIMELRNEQLNRDIEAKNRELAISKMNILKKNELLNEIKNELTNQANGNNMNSVARLIDRNLNNRKDWEVFVKAFNDTDKGFLDKLRTLHPDLTPNDLKFCIYLRLNLSSKEMAPLLNISVKSVETRRYRLRKRMNLPHEESLVNYILGL